MDTRRLLIGTLVGGVTVFVLGYLIFDLAFGAFYSANAGSATGVPRETQLVWAVALGSLSYGALLALTIAARAGSSDIGTGVKIGALVGFLLWFTADFILYGVENVSNLTRTIVDPVLEGVRAGISGGVIAVVLGKIR